jgi:hypothetical protein
MHPMRTANHQRVSMRGSLATDDLDESVELGQEQIRGGSGLRA